MVCRAFLTTGLLVAVLIVSAVRGGRPPGSDQGVRCFTAVRCDPTREIEFQSAADCCLGNGFSYNPPRTEDCINCVVFGWLNADSNQTIRVREAGPGQRFEVGFIKSGVAPPPPITLRVSDVEGTAQEGVANDYTLGNDLADISSTSNDAFTVTIRVDGVALEEDETFQLKFKAEPELMGEFFCIDVLNVVIEDGNEVDIQLTEDDYRAGEENNNIRVVISKNSVIATNVSLRITPVMVSEARERNLFPAGAVPPDDLGGRSPVNADLNDFDSTVINFTFQADENESVPINEIEVLVPIADDAINEASEQIFVVILNVTDSVNPSGVMLLRVSSLCRIVDNDPIRIGFEKLVNMFVEPMFEDDVTVYLAKENNTVSEQTFVISFQRTDSVPINSGFGIAEFGTDYLGIREEFTQDFVPGEQRLGLLVTLVADNIPEPTEAFQLNSSPQSPGPVFSNPIELPANTFVVIEDDDIIVQIGFEETSYIVSEETGFQEVCVRVFAPADNQPLDAQLNPVIQTVVGTADETDYTPLASVDVVLSFNNMSRRACFRVMITDDMLVEEREEFTLRLLESSSRRFPIQTVLNESMATVTILDQDEAVIGFFNTSYSADESSELITLSFGLLSGGAQNEVNIQLDLIDETALASADFNGSESGDTFTFNATTPTSVSYDILLVNDDVYELIERFNARLSFVEAVDRVTINPGLAQVQIQDDDVVRFGFSPDVYSEAESAGEVNLGVSFLAGSFGTAPISVQLSLNTINDTAVGSPAAEADFESIQQLLFELSESSASQLVPVTIFDDGLTENSEVFGASLSNPVVLVSGVERVLATSEAARIMLEPRAASIEITDNDETVIGFLQSEYSAFENQGSINFTIGVISGQLGIDAPFSFSTAEITDSAKADIDYVSVPGVDLVFNTRVSAIIPVIIIDDNIVEPTERFSGLLTSNSLPPNVKLSPHNATVSILEEGVIVIGWEQLVYNASESSGSVELCASVTSPNELQLEPFTLNVEYMKITADPNSDYSVPSSSVTIGPFSQASRRACVTVDITDDTVAENLETFSVMLVGSSNSPDRLTITPSTTSVDILDNDVITIGWELTSYTTSEDEDMVELCALITSPSSIDRDPFVLQVSCSPGSAAVGEDYQQCPSTIGPFDFGQNPPRACISVDIIDDSIPEDPEDFTVILQPSTDPLVSVNPSQTTVIIMDNDIIDLTLDPTPSVTVTEADGSLQICVQIINPPDSTAIQREPFFISISTMDGTATAPSDFSRINVSNFGPFSNTMRRHCVNITIVLDTTPETDEQFTITARENLFEVAISSPTTTVTIVDSIRRVNDTVIGDPLMTVPINLRNSSAIPKLRENAILNLCFEIHGDADTTFNLVSDGCVSVNAHYEQVRPTESQNIIDAVYVRAVDSSGSCHNIAVNLSGCSASVDGVSISSRYSQMGVSVRPYSNRVRIAVPNCADLDLVMWVICETRTFWSTQLTPGGQEVTFNAEMIKFVIARGLNLQETSHGILGQFWNIPIDVSPFDLSDANNELYSVTVRYPDSMPRSFTGFLWSLTWDYREEYCLYVGNSQAGPLDDADAKGGPNEPVLEGDYTLYKVDSSFATNFPFSHFDEMRCVGPMS